MDRWAPPLSRYLVMRECPGCGYSLEGLTAVRCPECGEPVFALHALRERSLTVQEQAWLSRSSWASEEGPEFGCFACLTAFIMMGVIPLGFAAFAPFGLSLAEAVGFAAVIWALLLPLLALVMLNGRRAERGVHAYRRDRSGGRARAAELEVRAAVRVHPRGYESNLMDLMLMRVGDDAVLFVEERISREDLLSDRSPRRITVEFLPWSGRVLRLRTASSEWLDTPLREVECVDASEYGRFGLLPLECVGNIVDLKLGEPGLFEDANG